ncbi:MAG: DNA photolyase [Deltaproteobacteria bacterium]|nr:DNA photolyase [Deltaproteobacteria bacterium]
MTMENRIRRILLEEPARDYPMARRVLSRLPGVPVTVIPRREVLRPPDRRRTSWLADSKTTLLLAVQKGPFRRPCPGTPDYLCCGYQVLQTALGCPMDCTYCILQSYVNVPAVTLFVNVEDLLQELEQDWNASPGKVWRLGTGEFGDSLALDDLAGLHAALIPFFAQRPGAALEIKSKWRQLEHLLPLGPNPQVIFAWSLNPEEVVRGEERFTASLKDRLQAAVQAAAAGFRLAFHFDPIIYFPGWEEAYGRTVALLGEAVGSADIAWISLGALRFLAPQRSLILERFPASGIAVQEMVRAPDGKLRYFIGLRQELYGRLQEQVAAAAPGALVYLCMESPRVWDAVFGFHPQDDDLARRLDARVKG